MGDRRELLQTLRAAASTLREVEERKMFGCEALFTRGSIFALVWKTGRIGVKLPDEGRFEALAKQKGAEPWRAGPMVMAHWLLVPPALEDAKKLAPWVKEAHEMAAAGLGKLKVPKKIRGVNRGGGKRMTKMAAKRAAQEAIQAAGDALAKTPAAARTVAEEVVRAVKKAAKAAAGAAKALKGKAKKKSAGKKAGAKKAGAKKAAAKKPAKKAAAKKPAKKKAAKKK